MDNFNPIMKPVRPRSITTINTIKAFLTMAALCVILTAHGQTRVTKDAKGNYHPVTHVVTRDTSVAIFTDKKGDNYPVYKSKNGKLYYERMSRSGNVYKCYIKEGK